MCAAQNPAAPHWNIRVPGRVPNGLVCVHSQVCAVLVHPTLQALGLAAAAAASLMRPLLGLLWTVLSWTFVGGTKLLTPHTPQSGPLSILRQPELAHAVYALHLIQSLQLRYFVVPYLRHVLARHAHAALTTRSNSGRAQRVVTANLRDAARASVSFFARASFKVCVGNNARTVCKSCRTVRACLFPPCWNILALSYPTLRKHCTRSYASCSLYGMCTCTFLSI